MNHDRYQELNTLSLYGELTSEEQEELTLHLVSCSSCLNDLAEKNRIKSLASETRMQVSDKLLSDARRDLRLAIANKSHSTALSNLFRNIPAFFTSSYKYALTAVLFVIAGVIIGRFTSLENKSTEGINIIPVKQQQNLLQSGGSIANVEFINNDTETGEVEFTFDAVKKMHIKGNVNDEQVQQLLTYAMVYGQNSGIKLNSLSMISSSPDSKVDNEIKEAALNLVRFDPNPGVRREALKLVRKIPYDEDVKKTLIYILSNDNSPGIRIEAINIIVDSKKEGSKISNEDVNIFKSKLQDEESQYMQYKFKTVLEENI